VPAALRCCVIGATGEWYRQVHHPSLERLVRAGRVTLAAASSRSESGRELVRSMGFARSCADAGEMLDRERPDYAVLCMAPRPMAELAGLVLERRVPLFMEKPAGHDLAAGRALAAVAERAGMSCMVAYNRRHCPLLVRAKELLAGRAVSQAVCEFLRNDVSAPARMLGSALHSVDALRFLLGEVAEFRGLGSAARYFDGKMVAASFCLGFAGGAAGSFTFNVRAGRSHERYRLFAGNWTVSVSLPPPGRFDDAWRLEVEEGGRVVESLSAADLPEERRCAGYAHGFWREHEHFVECLERSVRPEPGIAEGLASMELAQAMLEAVAPAEQLAR